MKWITTIKWNKALLAAFFYTIIATIIHQIESVISLKYYMMPEHFGVWSKLMMPSAGPPPIAFFITSIVLTFVTGLSLTLVYYYIRDLLPKSFIKRLLFFADLMIGTSFIFFTIPSYLLFNLPWTLHISWFISGFVILVSGSWIIIKLNK